MSWTVYRVLDGEGECIYAGVTTNVAQRWNAHRANLDGAAAIREYATFDEEWDALTVEGVIIDAERPRLNIRGNASHGQEPETDAEKIARLVQTLVNSTLENRRYIQQLTRPLTASELLRRLAAVVEKQESEAPA